MVHPTQRSRAAIYTLRTPQAVAGGLGLDAMILVAKRWLLKWRVLQVHASRVHAGALGVMPCGSAFLDQS
jgi:hypothetical protein